MTIMTAAQRRRWKDEELTRIELLQTHPYATPQSLGHSGAVPASLPSSVSNSKKINNPLHVSVHQQPGTYDFDPIWRSRSQQLLVEQPDQNLRPVRSRSRLQKRPSQRGIKSSHMSSTQKKAVLEQNNLTALPVLPDATAVLERSSSLRVKTARPSADPERPKTAKDKPSRIDASYSNGRTSFRDSNTALPMRPRTAPSVENIKARAQTRTPPPPTPLSTSMAPVKSPPPGTNRLPRHVALAPYDPSPLNPLYHIPSPPLSNTESRPSPEPKQSPNSEQPALAAQQRRSRALAPTEVATQQLAATVELHPNDSFETGKGTTTLRHHTDVTETLRPAVTQEVIQEHRIEIVQKEITREIHVHHYFTYVQPIRALEVLPARHFIVDSETGEKREIAAPEGWSMPANLMPRKPDTSTPAPITRHYPVNEQHPPGVLEPSPPPHPPPTQPLPPAPAPTRVPSSSSRRPPSSFQTHGPRKTSEDRRTSAASSQTGKWTPFPRSTSKASR